MEEFIVSIDAARLERLQRKCALIEGDEHKVVQQSMLIGSGEIEQQMSQVAELGQDPIQNRDNGVDASVIQHKERTHEGRTPRFCLESQGETSNVRCPKDCDISVQKRFCFIVECVAKTAPRKQSGS